MRLRFFLLFWLSLALSPQALGFSGSSAVQVEAYEAFSSGSEMRDKRKVGLSSVFAGATGLIGFNIDLNFSPKFSYSIGLGTSRGFQSFNTHIKRFLGGKVLNTYFSAGYSRWSSKDEDPVGSTSPGILKEKFLSTREINSGEFAENLFYPGIGAQYLFLDGPWVGWGIYGELLLLLDIDDFRAGPTAGIGTNYYF